MSGARGSRASGGAKPRSDTERSGVAVSIVGDEWFYRVREQSDWSEVFYFYSTQLKYLLDTTQVLTRVLTRHNSSTYSSTYLTQLEYLLDTTQVFTRHNSSTYSSTYSTQLEYLLGY